MGYVVRNDVSVSWEEGFYNLSLSLYQAALNSTEGKYYFRDTHFMPHP